MGDGLIACVDWLQVTFKVEHTVQEIIEFLGLNFSDFVGFDTGELGGEMTCCNKKSWVNMKKRLLNL